MKPDATIAVVGGGPAGATCAARLAAVGGRVTLFEAHPDHEKPCGGGIPGTALAEFPELADPALPRRVVTRVVIESPSGRSVPVDVPEGMHMFRRQQLDAFLRDRAVAAGATLRRARIRRVRRLDRGDWELASDEGIEGRFDFLVGADGVQGVVRRQVAGPVPEHELTLALYAYIPVSDRSDVVLKFHGEFDGYLWVFPRQDHLSIGICASSGTVAPQQLEERLRDFAERHYPESRAVMTGGMHGFFIPAAALPPAAGDGRHPPGPWALIGDAGGFADPMTREGIAHAMRSGARLAEDFAFRRQMGTPRLPGQLLWAHRHRAGFFRREFLDRMAWMTERSTAIRRIMGDLLSGRQRYRTLKARLALHAIPSLVEAAIVGGNRSRTGHTREDP